MQNNKLKDDFCKILGIYRTKNMYGITEEIEVSWAEVFAEIAKLKVISDFRNFTNQLDEVSMRIADIDNKLNKDNVKED